ncbi:MAG: hypothetical protein Q8P35_01875 [Candidatus Yanofskybacteria bacterium]|nr:hypothetical protein [Candidatus Yanofskybacteria bacterium]
MRNFPHYIYGRVMVSVFFVALVALRWTTWWQISMGQDSLWIPPRILFYLAVIAGIATGVSAWRKTNDPTWRKIFLILLLIVAALPFEKLWDHIFGPEALNSVLIVWSPPHLLILGALMAALILVLPVTRKDESGQSQRLFGGLALAASVDLGFIIAWPFLPLGPFQLIGFWGAGVISFIYAVGVLVANRRIPGFASSTIMAILLVLLTTFTVEGYSISSFDSIRYVNPPAWLITFALLMPAIVNDFMSKKFPFLLRGLVAGVVWGTILFGFSSIFLEPQFKYGADKIAQAVIASGVGGALAALMLMIFQTEKVIYKYSV